MAKWKVGKVTSVNIPGADDPHGFTVVKEGDGPIAIFVYPTQEACETAAKHIGLALEESCLCISTVLGLTEIRCSASGSLFDPFDI